MRPSPEQRARCIRSRTTVRAWEFRQRKHSQGVWFRLRRVLADAESAWAIEREAAERLIAEGFEPEAVGAELVCGGRGSF